MDLTPLSDVYVLWLDTSRFDNSVLDVLDVMQHPHLRSVSLRHNALHRATLPNFLSNEELDFYLHIQDNPFLCPYPELGRKNDDDDADPHGHHQ